MLSRDSSRSTAGSWGSNIEKQTEEVAVRQCVALNARGERCKCRPLVGTLYCVTHAAPSTKAAGLRYLLLFAEPAMETLFKALGTECHYTSLDGVTLCDVHGSECPEWSVRVNAAKAILDRCGYGPKATLALEKPGRELADVSTEELAKQLETLAIAARETAQREKEVIDVTANDAVN